MYFRFQTLDCLIVQEYFRLYLWLEGIHRSPLACRCSHLCSKLKGWSECNEQISSSRTLSLSLFRCPSYLEKSKGKTHFKSTGFTIHLFTPYAEALWIHHAILWRRTAWRVHRASTYDKFISSIHTETLGFRSYVDRTHKRWFPWPSFPQSSNTNPVIVEYLNSSRAVWMENIWCVFKVKPAFPNSSDVVWTELFFVIPFCGCLLCSCMSAMCIHQCCNSPCNWIQTCPACSLGLLLQRATALDSDQPESQQINIDKQCKMIFSRVS